MTIRGEDVGDAGSQGFKRYPTWNPEKGTVYCAVSTVKPGQVKIGACTMGLSERLQKLKNRHGLPDVIAVFSMQVSHPAKVEFNAQEALKACRVVGRTKGDSIEWYRISDSRAALALVQAAMKCGETIGTVDYCGHRHSEATKLLETGMFSGTVIANDSKLAAARSVSATKASPPKRGKDLPQGDSIHPPGLKTVLPSTLLSSERAKAAQSVRPPQQSTWNDSTQTDNPAWAQAMSEFDTGMLQFDLWATALALSSGDDAGAKFRYLTLRVKQLAESGESSAKAADNTPSVAPGAGKKANESSMAPASTNDPEDEESPWPKKRSQAVSDLGQTDHALGEPERELMHKYRIEYSNGSYYIGGKEFPSIWPAVQHYYFLQHLSGNKHESVPPQTTLQQVVPPHRTVPTTPTYSRNPAITMVWLTLVLLGISMWVDNSHVETAAPATQTTMESSGSRSLELPPALTSEAPPQSLDRQRLRREKVDTQRERIKNREIGLTPMKVTYFSSLKEHPDLPARLAKRKATSDDDTALLESGSTWWVGGKSALSLHIKNSTSSPIAGVLWHLGAGDCSEPIRHGHQFVMDFSKSLAAGEERIYRTKLPIDYRSQHSGGRQCGMIVKAFHGNPVGP